MSIYLASQERNGQITIEFGQSLIMITVNIFFFKASQYSSEERKDFSWSFPSWWLYVPNLHHNSKGKGEKSI